MTEIIIYADEDVDVAIVEGLRRRGIEAYSCLDFHNISFSDYQQIEFAKKKGFVLLTHDADFLRLIAEKNVPHPGILFVAQTRLTVGEIIRRIECLVSTLTMEELKNHVEFL